MVSQKVQKYHPSRMGGDTPFSLHRINSAARARKGRACGQTSTMGHWNATSCYSNRYDLNEHARPNDLRRLQTSIRCNIKRRISPHAQARKHPTIGVQRLFASPSIFPLETNSCIPNETIGRVTLITGGIANQAGLLCPQNLCSRNRCSNRSGTTGVLFLGCQMQHAL